MTKDTVKNYTLYKLRFWIGYALLAMAVIGVLTLAALYVPGGLTDAEQQSALRSATLSAAQPASWLIVDAPYHLLQKASIAILGITSFSVKLPSLLVGFATAAGLVLLLRRRFKQTISILAAGILVISAQYIGLATTGTPAIMVVFWPVMVLLAASYVEKRSDKTMRPWAIYLVACLAAFSLLTPFSIYVLAAFAVASLLHPHMRYILRKASSGSVALGGLIVAAVVAVVGYATYLDHSFAAALLYRSDHFSTDIVANLRLLGLQLGDVTSASTTYTGLLAPVFGLTALLLACAGAYHLLRWRHAALSFMLFAWLLVLVPILLLNPTMIALLIAPMAFLTAAGIRLLLGYWYSIFPRNPYARVFALVPVTILFACVIASGALRYFYTYRYDASLANKASPDIQLLQKELRDRPTIALLVSGDELPFYRAYLDSHNMKNIALSDKQSDVVQHNLVTKDVIATKHSTLANSSITPTRIIASDKLHTYSDRLYVYKKSDK